MASVKKERRVTGSHRAVVDTMARDFELPVDEIESAYLSEVKKIEKGARIKTFVSVLAAGNVRSRLRRMRDASRGAAPRILPDG